MSRNFHLLLWMPLLYCVFFVVAWVRLYAIETSDFDDYVLEIQTNYAVDSAVDEMLVEDDINISYDSDEIALNPQTAITDLEHTLCLDFGYDINDSNRGRVRNENIISAVVCVNDGLYTFAQRKTSSEKCELKQSPKIPYYYKNDTRQYCLTFNNEKGAYGEATVDNTYAVHEFGKYPEGYALTPDENSSHINNYVADMLNRATRESNCSNGELWDITLPAITGTLRGQQPISGPSVLLLVRGNTRSFQKVPIAGSIGGTHIVDSDPIIGYTFKNKTIPNVAGAGNSNINMYEEDGTQVTGVGDLTLNGNFYASSSWWLAHDNVRKEAEESSAHAFDSEFDAACAGYQDLNYIGR